MNRSRVEIISLILQSAIAGASKVKIMYNAYLSYGQAKEYLGFLEKKELVQYDWKTRHYITTMKGKKLLSSRHEINELAYSMKNTISRINPIPWY